MKRNIITLIVCAFACLSAHAQTEEVLTLMRRANDYFMQTVPDPKADSHTDKVRPSHIWTRGVYYEGLMALYEVDPQQRYLDYTDEWAQYHGWSPRSSVWKVHADDQCCTQTYMYRYFMEGGDEKFIKAKADFDNEMEGTDRTTHYQDWTWIDALQMAMPAYAMMTNITGDRRYIDYAMEAYLWTRNTLAGGLFVEKTGLWWRDKALYNSSEGYWSRGNGWVIAAQVRVMDQLNVHDKYYDQLKSDFLAMCKALPALQREDGSWSSSLNVAKYAGKELTGTALFLYGLSWGIRQGYLPKDEYLSVVQKAWDACASCVHDNGFLGYVQGTADRPSKGYPFTYDAVPNFEDYGLGCFLLGAAEYYKLLGESAAAVPPVKGDVDGDGVVTMSDANEVVNIYLQKSAE